MTIENISSNQTWACPTGVTSVLVECWGCGGGGQENGGGGAGGGAYSASTIVTVPSDDYLITGLSLSGTPHSTNGADVVFADDGSTPIVMAKGGTTGDGDDPGFGGTAAASLGDSKLSGEDGSSGGSGGAGANSGGAGGVSAGDPGTAPGGGGAGSGGLGGNGLVRLTYEAAGGGAGAIQQRQRLLLLEGQSA